MKKIYQYFIRQRWHLHSLALVINWLFFFCGKEFNFMHLNTVSFGFKAFLSLFGTFVFAFVLELLQMKKGANRTKLQWLLYAVPDIIFTTVIGFVGFLLFEL